MKPSLSGFDAAWWSCLLLHATGLFLAANGCKEEDASSARAAENQAALIRESGFHADQFGAAVTDYARAVDLLKDAGWTSGSLEELLGNDSQIPENGLGVFDQAVDCVLRGAKKQNTGLPDLSWFDTKFTLGSDTVDIGDLSLPAKATLVVARRAARKADHDRSRRLGIAVFAMGQHLAPSDNDLASAVGIVSKQKALELLREIAVEEGDSKSVAAYDAMRADVDKELQAHKNRSHNREPGLREFIDVVR